MRMVGHYWLRNPKLAPKAFLKLQIENMLEQICEFADQVISGKRSESWNLERRSVAAGCGRDRDRETGTVSGCGRVRYCGLTMCGVGERMGSRERVVRRHGATGVHFTV
ncbi:unnamed protein product [Fraxinus pennsylvanica]|uniref:Uncharacterized protein n=1 Tax=Fraxinus pennsylvanica TaxID=56036 RepID=A0AAD2E8X3_9LAMI|nr:unnamed protein product [Fraxinus pennsylvanica]